MQLVFLHLEREDFMAYQCVCRNTLGIADSVVRLYRNLTLFYFIFFECFVENEIIFECNLEIHPVADDGNEVYSEADQQDGLGGGKEQLSSTWDGKYNKHLLLLVYKIKLLCNTAEKSKDESSTKRLAVNKHASAKTQLAVGGRSSSAVDISSWFLSTLCILVSMTKTR